MITASAPPPSSPPPYELRGRDARQVTASTEVTAARGSATARKARRSTGLRLAAGALEAAEGPPADELHAEALGHGREVVVPGQQVGVVHPGGPVGGQG